MKIIKLFSASTLAVLVLLLNACGGQSAPATIVNEVPILTLTPIATATRLEPPVTPTATAIPTATSTPKPPDLEQLTDCKELVKAGAESELAIRTTEMGKLRAHLKPGEKVDAAYIYSRLGEISFRFCSFKDDWNHLKPNQFTMTRSGTVSPEFGVLIVITADPQATPDTYTEWIALLDESTGAITAPFQLEITVERPPDA